MKKSTVTYMMHLFNTSKSKEHRARAADVLLEGQLPQRIEYLERIYLYEATPEGQQERFYRYNFDIDEITDAGVIDMSFIDEQSNSEQIYVALARLEAHYVKYGKDFEMRVVSGDPLYSNSYRKAMTKLANLIIGALGEITDKYVVIIAGNYFPIWVDIHYRVCMPFEPHDFSD